MVSSIPKYFQRGFIHSLNHAASADTYYTQVREILGYSRQEKGSGSAAHQNEPKGVKHAHPEVYKDLNDISFGGHKRLIQPELTQTKRRIVMHHLIITLPTLMINSAWKYPDF